MRVVETHDIGGEDADEYNGKGSLDIEIFNEAGGRIASLDIRAGEPEDALFFRDLSGALSITDMMREAYEAGKNGEPYIYEYVNEGEDE